MMDKTNHYPHGIKVSVIVPVYNVELYLEDCLESILRQTLADIEILCIDDGSTDGSREILDRFHGKDGRIKIIAQKNGGLSVARNAGIENAKGEYLCFVDGDDMLSGEDALQKMYDSASRKSVQMLAFNCEVIYETKTLEMKNCKDLPRRRHYSNTKTGRELFMDMMEADEFLSYAWLMFLRRGWLDKNSIRFVPGLLYEDVLFSFECYMKAQTAMHLDDSFYIYRVRNGSITTDEFQAEDLYSYAYIYAYLLRRYLTMTMCSRLQRQVARYIKKYLLRMKDINDMLPPREKKRVRSDDTYLDLCLESLEVGKYADGAKDPQMYLAGFEYRIIQADKIILYGAGKIGSKIYSYIQRLHKEDKVACFAVSGYPGTDGKKQGLPVRNIEDLQDFASEPGVLVIVSAKDAFQEDMMERLKRAGFGNYVAVGWMLERLVDRFMAEKESSLAL